MAFGVVRFAGPIRIDRLAANALKASKPATAHGQLPIAKVLSSRRTPLVVFTGNPIFFDPISRRLQVAAHALKAVSLLVAIGLLGLVAGCGRFRSHQNEIVYVSARHMFLHDRVAAVSERVAEVANGDRLQVLEHGRRFLKVKTEKDQIGWIEERAVIYGKTYDSFIELAKAHKDDPVASTATLRDDLYLHLLPGRKTENFYLLAGNTKVQLLARASVPRNPTPNRAPKPPDPLKATTPAKTSSPVPVEAPPEVPAPIMEDWWLARDGQGRTGWLLGSRLDVDVPEVIMQYGEGQRFIGTWELAKVTDPEATTPDHQVPEYLTVTAPLRSGLPFDFDEVRVFTWSLRHHRYETAFRLHPIQGFLPVRVSSQPASSAGGKTAPAFSFEIAGSENIATDTATGMSRPANPRTINYQMIDTRVIRTGPDMAPIPIMRDAAAEKKAKDKKALKKGRK
jgi:hypothetical protein